MRVLYVCSEVFPLAKTGGLADVSAALPHALSELGVDVRLLLPGYPQAIEEAANVQTIARIDGLLGLNNIGLLAARLPDSGVPIFLVDCPSLYGRSGGLYQADDGCDWPDNPMRFALLNHVGAKIADGTAINHWRPNIIHAHDWHAGLLPLLLSRRGGSRTATLLTIHNLAYQGTFPADHFGTLGLSDDPCIRSTFEFYGKLSFLKAGISCADALTTVSPTYAKEILTPEYGCGLDGLLRERADRLTGIMNGADYRIWDPATDLHLAHRYRWDELSPKRACKAALQEDLGLDVAAEVPLIAFMSRLAHQKMPDVVLEALPTLVAEGAQFALLAEGDSDLERRFQEFSLAHPRRVSVRIGYQEALAHRLLAGADILLHPSRYEPCGLAPIYALRYGTLPLVRRSGGLADSVVDAIEDTVACETATGFSFEHSTASDLIECVRRALMLFRQPIRWRKIQLCAMRKDFGWQRSALAYADLYGSLAPFAANRQLEDSREPLKRTA